MMAHWCRLYLWVCLLVLRLTKSVLAQGSSGRTLAFREDGTFKILQLTDLHLGENYENDESTIKAVDAVLKAEVDVDLVVLSGDMVSGFAHRIHGQGLWEMTYMPLIDKLDAAGVPHAIVLGNHDSEGILSREQIVELDRKSRLSVTQAGPTSITGATNYWLDIHSSSGSVHPGARLWLLDSMSTGCEGVAGWGCVAYDTVSWLHESSAKLDPVTVAAAFVHIPVPEFVNAWEHGTSHGYKGEPTCCPSCNTGLFDAFLKIGVTAIYSGHDHDNDFVTTWRGIRLAYGRKSGYGSYGPPEGFYHGGRVIILQEDENAAHSFTYLRLETGRKHTQEPAIKTWQHQQASCSSNFFRRRWSRNGLCPRKSREGIWPGWATSQQ